MKRFLYGLMAWCLSLGVAGQVKAQFIFTSYDPPDSTSTNPMSSGINNSGQIVGPYVDAGGSTHGYLLSGIGGSFTTFDVPGITGSTFGNGINDSGQIVGRYLDAGGTTHGYLLSGIGGSFTLIDVPGSTFTNTRAINASGQIVGRYDAGGITHGFLRMSDGSFTTFDVPGATSFGTGGINASGQIVGNYTDASGTHGYLLSGIGGSFTTFDVPGAASTFVNGINDSGQILGSYDAGGTRHGFVLSEGIYTTIEVPGANLTSTHGINNFGQVVGTYSDAGGMLHGFVATPMPAFRITAAPTAVAGTPFDVTVTALEAYGKIDTTYQGTVTFTTTDPDSGVVLPADYTFTTGDGGDNGVHTFPGGVTLATVGDQTLSGTDTVSGAVGSASVTVGPGP